MQPALESAFRRTRYRVWIPDGELVLRVDQHEPALIELLNEAGAHCAALLTAFNPGGRRQAPFRNRQSQQRLREQLRRQGCRMFAGRNEDPRGRWMAEPSFLVPGLPFLRAEELAASYRQAAFLWMEKDGTPRLIEAAAYSRRT
jgi:hypothetical protein